MHANGYQHGQIYPQSASPAMCSLGLPLADTSIDYSCIASNEGHDFSLPAHFEQSGNPLNQAAFDQGLRGYPPPSDGCLTGTRASSSQGHCSEPMFPASPIPHASFDSDTEDLYEPMVAPTAYASIVAETVTSGGLANYYLPIAPLDAKPSPFHLDDSYANTTASTNEEVIGLVDLPDDGTLGLLEANDLCQFDTSTALVPDADNSNRDTTAQLSSSVEAAGFFGSHEETFYSPVDTEAAESPLPITDHEARKSGQKRKRRADVISYSTEYRKKIKSHEKGVPTSDVTDMDYLGSRVYNADSRPEATGTPIKAFNCAVCPFPTFPTQKDLDRHVKSKHGQYPCLLNFTGGCDKFFHKKNEWKRHCLTQHIVESYYTCPEEACQGKSDAFFLRKDLFKAHLDRLHTSDDVRKEHKDRQAADKARRGMLAASGPKQRKKSSAATKGRNHAKTNTAMPFQSIRFSQEYEDTYKKHRAVVKGGLRWRVKLPEKITCEAPDCGQVFDTKDAFNKYMEHVGKHLERIASGGGPDHAFGVELVPYFTAIGILKATCNTPETNGAPWKLVSVNAQTEVEDKYAPDSKSD
ncbi:zinc c2h2 finger domain containing protein [Ophiostoma piceae UAMH 11346]|uniref:Zinc c2h2 finger domain containing protein n=1 Tax=Ophiostoma piceae (strain UAMH 11346) TaxID=1262450 RepID=S3CF33_OPHP1|nr:zinc c2h2 finger domain containing protein [Ophiostoma piceae UAMH 11346]